MPSPLICEVYKSRKDEEMYLFISREEKFERVPEVLLTRFNDSAPVTSFVLTPDRKLARADAAKVISSIEEQGFYLQMPPRKSDLMDTPIEGLVKGNEKLLR